MYSSYVPYNTILPKIMFEDGTKLETGYKNPQSQLI